MSGLHPARWFLALTVLLGGAAAPAAAGEPAEGSGLAPGFAIVISRNQRELVLRIDRDAVNIPNRLHGQRLVCRRLMRTVYAPQSSTPLAEEWRMNGAAEVLPVPDRSGLPLAVLLWEDPQLPVAMGDRVELGRLAPEAARPQVLALRIVSQRAPQGQPASPAEPVAAPGEEVWAVADIYCPTGEAPQCEWAADAGEFVHAGGTAAGKTIQGVRAVRWRAPADAQAGAKATLRLKVTTPCRVLTAEESLTVRIEDPKGAYARVQWVPIRLRPAGGGRPTAVFAEASLLAAGPLGSFFLVDAPGKRLAHWGQLGPRFAPLGSGPVAGLTAHGEVAFITQGGQVLAWQPGAEQPQPLAKLPALKRMAGLHANAAGDLYAVDAGESLSLHVLPPKVGSWQQALLEPKGDAAWLAHCALDWHSNDIFAYDSRDRVVRQWRALQGIAYHPVAVAMPAGSAVDRFGPPIAILPRWDADHDVELPVQLVFKSGAVTDRWNYEARPPRWEPLVRRPPRELAAARFTAHSAAAMPDGDLLLGGQATVADETVPLLAQLSPTGELRQTLPLPELPPRCIAAAPDGRRYVLLAHRTQRLVALSPEGWVARDLGVIEAIKPIVRVRADRSSPDHIYLVGSKGSRESAFRLNALNPSAYLELSAQGFPGSQIPDHEAVDVAASPHFVAVLDRGGKILVFANEKPLRLITVVETALRRPAAIALVAASHDADGARQPFLCVLPSGRDATSIYIWQLRTAGGGKPTVTAVGTVPDPANAAARLASPVTLDSAFPDRPGTLFVLDRGGAQVRSFDLPAIVEKLNQRLDPGIPTSPVLDKLPAGEGGVDMAIGPGQLIHIADTAGEAIHSFARCR